MDIILSSRPSPEQLSDGANKWNLIFPIYIRDVTFGVPWTRGEPIMLKNLPIMLCHSARKRYLLCSTFVPIMLNFFQLCSSKY